MLNVKRSVLIVFALMVFMALDAVAGSPQAINIRGQLLDADGHGLPGARAYSVQFYDAASSGNALGAAIAGAAEVSLEGLFNLEVIPPPQALLAPQAWYEVAISSAPVPGPLGPGDVFPDRVKMQSVPFALESSNAAHVEVSAIGAGTIIETEFGFLSGLTGNIQNQLDAKANAADMYTRTEVDDSKVAKAGDTMTGPLEMVPAAAPGTVTDKLYNVGGTLQWNGNPAYRFPWTMVTADTQMAGNKGYIVNSGTAMVSLTLPASSSLNVGDTVRVSGLGAAGWKIAQAASQTIVLDSLNIPNYRGGWTARMTDAAREWYGVASSADGTKLAAVSANLLCTSSDGGATWTVRDSSHNWLQVVSSADGTKLVAGEYPGHLWRSADSGVTWTEITSTPPGAGSWYSLAMSADGSKVYAASMSEGLYASTDSGLTWSTKSFLEIIMDPRWIYYVACSADGATLLAGEGDGYLWTSTDSGATWASHYTDNKRSWICLGMSADGRKMVASEYWSHHYTSLDRGATWLDHVYQGNRFWSGLAVSADGSIVFSSDGNGALYTSTNGCATWEPAFSPNPWPSGVALSSDGRKAIAAAVGGYLYTYAYGGTLAASTPGTGGYLAGGENSAVELQYVGNNTFVPVSHAGSLGAY